MEYCLSFENYTFIKFSSSGSNIVIFNMIVTAFARWEWIFKLRSLLLPPVTEHETIGRSEGMVFRVFAIVVSTSNTAKDNNQYLSAFLMHSRYHKLEIEICKSQYLQQWSRSMMAFTLLRGALTTAGKAFSSTEFAFVVHVSCIDIYDVNKILATRKIHFDSLYILRISILELARTVLRISSSSPFRRIGSLQNLNRKISQATILKAFQRLWVLCRDDRSAIARQGCNVMIMTLQLRVLPVFIADHITEINTKVKLNQRVDFGPNSRTI
ncbi:hypothetical protein C0J52_09716 [Blattella germanica]|nr:hypothetical protein C0J52_09716 [Blattella germanica]